MKYNNSYKYRWSFKDGLVSKSNPSISCVFHLKEIFVINYLLNKYLGLDKGGMCFKLGTQRDINDQSIVICEFLDEFQNEYGYGLRVIKNPSETLYWLNELEIDSSGLDKDIVEVYGNKKEEVIILKESYINKILHNVSNEDIEEGFEAFDMFTNICEYFTSLYKDGFIGMLNMYNSNCLYIRSIRFKSYIKKIKNKLSYIGIDYFLDIENEICKVYKIKDINVTKSLLRIIK